MKWIHRCTVRTCQPIISLTRVARLVSPLPFKGFMFKWSFLDRFAGNNKIEHISYWLCQLNYCVPFHYCCAKVFRKDWEWLLCVNQFNWIRFPVSEHSLNNCAWNYNNRKDITWITTYRRSNDITLTGQWSNAKPSMYPSECVCAPTDNCHMYLARRCINVLQKVKFPKHKILTDGIKMKRNWYNNVALCNWPQITNFHFGKNT